MSSDSPVPLSQGAGYGVVVGIGLAFGIGMILVSKFLEKFLSERSDKTEMFMVANRSIGTGLTASAVISSWMWATVLIWSVAQTYLYGIAAPFWYAAGCSIQIALMTVLAIHAKIKVPNGHTLLEIIRFRYGTTTHIVFIFMCFATNLLSVTSMILGAAGVITALTGMHIVASIFLLPLGVMVYTVAGGLKATFLTDYIHTLIVLVILCFLTIRAFNNTEINGLSSFYDALVEADKTRYIEGNYEGSILSFKSKGSIIFGLVHSFGDFALVIMDTSFWQKGFAADTAAAMPGYMLGGISYFAAPWAIGTTAGLASIALEGSPIFPTYPRKMTTAEVNGGSVLPYVAMAYAGTGGAWAVLLVVFMCVTSTTSAELIAVSSIYSFDVYHTYINPQATDKQVIRASHWAVICFGIVASGFSTGLHYGGIDLNWIGYFLATIICPGIFPLAFTILWKRQSRAAATWAPLMGLGTGIGVWLGTAYAYAGELTVLSTEAQLPCLWGAMSSTFSGGIYSVIITLCKPENFDWRIFLLLNEIRDDSQSSNTSDDDNEKDHKVNDNEKDKVNDSPGSDQTLSITADLDNVQHPYPPEELNRLTRAGTIASVFSVVVGLLTWVVWPLPLYRNYIFNAPFFKGWTTVSLIWLFICLLVAVVYPIYDGRRTLAKAFRALWEGLSGKRQTASTTASNKLKFTAVDASQVFESDDENNNVQRKDVSGSIEEKKEKDDDHIHAGQGSYY